MFCASHNRYATIVKIEDNCLFVCKLRQKEEELGEGQDSKEEATEVTLKGEELSQSLEVLVRMDKAEGDQTDCIARYEVPIFGNILDTLCDLLKTSFGKGGQDILF